jgi:hypothetical protein
VKVIVKLLKERGKHPKRKQWALARWHRSPLVYKLKEQMEGKIWAVFAG